MYKKEFGLLFAIIMILTFGLQLSGAFFLNLGQVLYNKDRKHIEHNEDSQYLEMSERYFEIVTKLNSGNRNAYRAAGYVALSADNKEEALDYWRKINNMDEELIARGDIAWRSRSFDDALEWYELALKLGADQDYDPFKVAHSCQQALLSNNYDVCVDGSIFDSENLFIDSAFQSDTFSTWRDSYPEQGNLYFTDCPGLSKQRCATIVVADGEIQSGASIYQRIKVSSDKKYEFSVWLKVEADPDTSWRSTYVQGLLDGEWNGYWPGFNQGSSDWQEFSFQFTGLDFDEGYGTFHPVRLHNNGQVWINNPILRVVSDEQS